MKIEKILNDFGYILVGSDNEKQIYNVIFSDEHKFKLCKDVNFDLSRYEYNLNDEFTVKIDEVGFNQSGDLYVVLKLLNDDCWDVLEYNDIPF